MRERVAEPQRSAPPARARSRAQKLKSELPTIPEDRAGEQIQKMEGWLQSDLRQLGEEAGEENTALLNEQLSECIHTLDRVSPIRARTLTHLWDSSRVAEQKVEMVVEVDEAKNRDGFCPNCASTNIRRACRHGVFEEFFRLFFIAPFRCHACRHEFYRF